MKPKNYILLLLLLFIATCCSSKKVNTESMIYKIETKYSGENPVDSCIIFQKITFKNGQYLEISYYGTSLIDMHYFNKDGKEFMVIAICKPEIRIDHHFYDEQGNHTKSEYFYLPSKVKKVAKSKNYYDTDNRIKKQICYDFDSNVVKYVNTFCYDTLGYSMVEYSFNYPNTIPSETHYYQNGLLVKNERLGGRQVVEYEYDSLGRFVYEDKLFSNERLYYSYTGDLLDKIVEVGKTSGDTISIRTYHYILDSSQRPIKTISTIVFNRNKEKAEKTLTITEYK